MFGQQQPGLPQVEPGALGEPPVLPTETPRWKTRKLRDLAGYRPTRFEVDAWPEEDREDDWHSERWQSIYGACTQFATVFMPRIDVSTSVFADSPWSILLPEAFLEHAAGVVQYDVFSGGWDPVLRSKERRAWLVTGILARILDTEVFGPLLFGASKSALTALESQDDELIDREGK